MVLTVTKTIVIKESSVSSLELLDGDKVAVIGHREDYVPVDLDGEEFGGILTVYDLYDRLRLSKKSRKCDSVEINKTEVKFICDGLTVITLNGTRCIAVSTCNA